MLPKLLGLGMAIDAVAHGIAFAYIERRQILVALLVADQDIDTGAAELVAAAGREPSLAWEHHADTGPVHPIDETDTIRVTVDDENANGKGIAVQAASLARPLRDSPGCRKEEFTPPPPANAAMAPE